MQPVNSPSPLLKLMTGMEKARPSISSLAHGWKEFRTAGLSFFFIAYDRKGKKNKNSALSLEHSLPALVTHAGLVGLSSAIAAVVIVIELIPAG